ncbi:MAG: UDP-glucose/GDP-mannose dehydrogenase family protein [Actinomycetia bacterium]|nr:UDP-glucose/GDP-mannose dehydrogenase family protein [Actinomycetes bacterium]
MIGTGYLGATHAAAMAEMGHDVIGIDVDATKVAALSQGAAPFYEPGLDALLAKQLASGRLRFSSDPADAAAAEIHFICVGTPQSPGSNAADTSYVEAAVDALAPHLAAPTLVVGKSTVPVGTAERLAHRLAEKSPAGSAVHLAWNPEFLREGFAVADTLHPDRLVIGVTSPEDEKQLAALFEPQLTAGTPMVVTDYATAELVKVAANSFLATKISFINAMAEVCEATGADVTTLAEAIGYDERIGRRFLQAGIGFGGGCLPKDLRAFTARAGELGLGPTFGFLRQIDEINMRRRSRTVEIAAELLPGPLLGARVAVLGVAFKPDSDDVRDSPALNIGAALHLQGAQVRVYDPKAMANAQQAFPTLTYVDSAEAALRSAELVLLLTEWDEFVQLDPIQTGQIVTNRIVLDGRNALDRGAWRAAGWTYRGLGLN